MSNLNISLYKSALFKNESYKLEINVPIKWIPAFQKDIILATPILSYLVSIYMIVIFTFVMIKCTITHGFQIWMIYKPNCTKFAKRPEILIFFMSTVPTIITIFGRSAWKFYYNTNVEIGTKWGSCQTVYFFDIFSRLAGLYHMLYWTYSSMFNGLFYRCHLIVLAIRDIEPTLEDMKQFKLTCKHRTPWIIYFFSFIVAMPILIEAKKLPIPNSNISVCQHISAYNFYHYFEIVGLVIIPLIGMTIRFYTSALNRDKSKKMKYRLRCYHVIYILLNIPIFVLYIVYEVFTALRRPELSHTKFANGIIIALTAHHTAFIIKPLVYTTGCNCICCSDVCLTENPKVNRWVLYWSTPQQKNKNIYSQPIQVTID